MCGRADGLDRFAENFGQFSQHRGYLLNYLVVMCEAAVRYLTAYAMVQYGVWKKIIYTLQIVLLTQIFGKPMIP